VARFTPNPRSTTAALPKVQFNNESTVDPVLSSQIVTNTWDFGVDSEIDDTSSMHSPLYFYPSDTGTYTATLTVTTQYGCSHSTTGDIVIGPDILVYIPNAFSPDASGPIENDGFRAIVNDGAETYHLSIFNRWGELIWESADRNEEWDGKYGTSGYHNGVPYNNRQDVPQGVYGYLLEITSWSGERYKYTGTVTLTR
jgi:gliding motility-associated-like protein